MFVMQFRSRHAYLARDKESIVPAQAIPNVKR